MLSSLSRLSVYAAAVLVVPSLGAAAPAHAALAIPTRSPVIPVLSVADVLPPLLVPPTPAVPSGPSPAESVVPDPLRPAASRSQATPTPLTGLFRVTAGSCAGAVAGSRFRMLQPGATKDGPWVQNSDSPCSDNTYTPLRPGTSGGLLAGRFQPHPSPAFNGTGGGLAGQITAPQPFFGVRFATATSSTDPQTGTAVPAPRVAVDDAGRLTGDLRAFGAAWNGQHFNQGGPKPDGSTPGLTTVPSGRYDARSGEYTLEWSSRIVGGPFNNFTGVWHLTGTFAPEGAAARPEAAAGAARPRPGAPDTPVALRARSGAPQGTLPLTGSGLPAGLPAFMLLTAAAAVALRRRLGAVDARG
ncbi:MAG TPA: hypothetical protein VNA14_00990 [Mycobacteriales bacterium]|nr:hypothetical protein [Mycobacteriales bacterium]